MTNCHTSVLVLTFLSISAALAIEIDSIRIDQIEKIELTTVADSNPVGAKEGVCRLYGEKAKKYLQILGIGQPIRPGAPAAMITGHLNVIQKDRQYTFQVYNSRLLNDEKNADVYVPLNKELSLKDCLSRR